MSSWRRHALEILPELKKVIELAESPFALWLELTDIFLEAADSSENDLVKRILMYASWCTSDKSGEPSNNAHQAVCCGFLEDITRNRKHWVYFKEWFSRPVFNQYKASFQYALNDKEYKELEDQYFGR